MPIVSARLAGPLPRYVAALLAVSLALLIRVLLIPVLHGYLPYITLFAAVTFSAWFCGLGPSVLAVAAACFGARYFLLLPAHSFRLPDVSQSLGMLMFLFISGIIIVFGEISYRSNQNLKRVRAELEHAVQQRTAELNTANQSIRQLTGHVLHLQDEERRRIARELHDSAGQSLAALALDLSAMKKHAGAAVERLTDLLTTAEGSAALIEGLTTEIRTISYLLHPPLLDDAGLQPALDWFVRGFAERSKIKVDLNLSEDFGRLSNELETAIFRVVQEALTNIHRHSESSVAEVRVTRSKEEVRIEIRDEGKGIAPERLSEVALTGPAGVGIRGMRERLRQLGGELEIQSRGPGEGTSVIARLPLDEARAKVAGG